MINIEIKTSIKCNEPHSMFVTFDYDPNIVNAIRSLPTRYWDSDSKAWEIPLNQLGKLTDLLSMHEFDITGPYVNLSKPTSVVPGDFAFKTTPFAHQLAGFQFGLDNDRWLLGDEQGLGKTKQVIDIAVAKKIQRGYKHCLIICGVNGLKWNWLNEIATHSNESGYILGQRTNKAGKISIGSTKDKLCDIRALDDNPSYFIITNVETLRDTEITSEIASACVTKRIGIVAIDEIHKCKNPSSQQGKAILKIQPEVRIAMTGTPLMNTPMDLFIILKWLGYEKHSFYSFRNHYAVMGGYGGYQITGYRNLPELQSRLDDIMLRRLKKDVLDLPEKLYIDEYVDMTPKQAIVYKEAAMEIQNSIDMIKASPNPLSELIRMRQATGYTGILSSTIKESAKLDRMEELVEEAKANGKKVVIFSNWTQMTDAIYDRLSKICNCCVITGDTRDIDRQEIVDDFQSGSRPIHALIGTIGAMGTGLTLTAGTVEIFMDEPWTMAAKMQAEDRCHRISATENITIYTLMCKGTIDEKIHELVQKKGELADTIVDGKVVASKSDLLDFLLS